jgi:DNA-directed RNA polymerase specialized sigma24 family protein
VGVCGIDVTKQERQLERMFPLHTIAGVTAFLKNKHHLAELQYYAGDYDATNLLVDFEKAKAEANLTDRQQEILNYVYEKDLSLTYTAKMLGIKKQSVKRTLEQGIKRLSLYYSKIVKDGDYNV